MSIFDHTGLFYRSIKITLISHPTSLQSVANSGRPTVLPWGYLIYVSSFLGSTCFLVLFFLTSQVYSYTSVNELSDSLHEILNNEKYLNAFQTHWKKWLLAQNNSENVGRYGAPPLNCASNMLKSSEVPKSVHALMPGDIKVIAAMGDSLTVRNRSLSVP